jgi:hypothetical protein
MKLQKRVLPCALPTQVKGRQRSTRSLPFRSLFGVVAGALILTAALVPKADATVLIYFNFEDAVLGGPFDPASDDVPPLGDNPGGGIQHSTLTTNMTATAAVDGFLENRTAGDIDTADPGLAMGMRTTPLDNGHFIEFAVDATFFQNMSLSFAVNTAGNGFNTVQLSYFVGGVETIVGSQPILTAGVQIITFAVPPGANNQPTLVLRLTFDGGTSNGNNLQTVIDNIQLNGTVVPEPATVVGGLLGAFGLCWHQRRRLIRSVRLQRA